MHPVFLYYLIFINTVGFKQCLFNCMKNLTRFSSSTGISSIYYNNAMMTLKNGAIKCSEWFLNGKRCQIVPCFPFHQIQFYFCERYFFLKALIKKWCKHILNSSNVLFFLFWDYTKVFLIVKSHYNFAWPIFSSIKGQNSRFQAVILMN